ncbi:TerC/Alx family metal homeostasis membrane protein [Curtobacterium ammoniigenes]|uniref:TerC/Alx family metal homeostasis membrane protein n=1 Tax=Curtobacterium ammoniigenes TaxID=395387 RepID=UPI00082AE436|nr:TerC/Alx family metal homeostasis membrane protein [Curtobacterium ammoniigenes]
MDVTPLVWIATIVGIVALLAFDFIAHVRTPHEPSMREAAVWSAISVAIAILFGVGIWVFGGHDAGGAYFAGWLTEKALSVDNLFVFLLIMNAFAVPRSNQQKVLLVGVAIALLARGLFIALGVAIISAFSWVFYLFGALLFWLAWTQARGTHDDVSADEESRVVRVLRRVIPTAPEFDGDRLTTIVGSRRMLTPMFIAMVAIGLTDVLFALDSIPAIFGLTQDAFIVFTANAFSLIGLRQLYFLIAGLLQRLVFLGQGLAVILAFIAVKLVLHAMHENTLPFINGGAPIEWAPEIPIGISLGVIVTVIAVATAASLIVSARRIRNV